MSDADLTFGLLDLALPGTPGAAAVPVRRAAPGWAVNAVIAAEVIGPPLALRPAATPGEPRAF